MNPRKAILKVEKRLFQENRRIINDATIVSDKNFKSYWNHYQRSVKDYQAICQLKEVINKVQKSQIILAGDYHTLDQSQRSFVRILRYLFKDQPKAKVVIALETLQSRHQKHLDAYMAGEIDTEAFIKKIGFKKHWFFDLWSNYEIIFDFSKYHQIPVRAIDADHRKPVSLLGRDEHMAEHLLDLTEQYPEHTIMVLVGDLHLAPKHLPLKISKEAKARKVKPPKVLQLYQNSPEIYWQLSEKGKVDHTDFVRISPTEYCRMHTPPLIVQQSYLNWLYHDEGTFDWADPKTNFLDLVHQMAHILDLRLPDDHERVEVYTCGDLSFLETLKRKRIFTPQELKFVNFQVRHEHSYFLPRARMVYIANVSIHHAAEEASHYLKFLFSGEEFPRHRKDAFYANVLHEAVGFFGSKLINSKRKCPRLQDFQAEKRFLEKSGLDAHRNLEYDTASLFIEHSRKARSKKELIHTNKIANLSSALFLALTHAIGYDLGDHLYYGFMDGKVTKTQIQHLYQDRFEDDGEPGKLYLNLLSQLKSVKRPRNL